MFACCPCSIRSHRGLAEAVSLLCFAPCSSLPGLLGRGSTGTVRCRARGSLPISQCLREKQDQTLRGSACSPPPPFLETRLYLTHLFLFKGFCSFSNTYIRPTLSLTSQSLRFLCPDSLLTSPLGSEPFSRSPWDWRKGLKVPAKKCNKAGVRVL